MRVPSTEVQNNFGKYIKIASELEDVIITRQGKEVAKLVSCEERPMLAEEAVNYVINGNRKMSYEQFQEFAEKTDARYELIDGEVFLLASPGFMHQKVVAKLLAGMSVWFEGKKCMPLTAPFDITLERSKDNICVVQPDIVVICDVDKVDAKDRYKGIPAIAVEVLSQSTKSRDMVKKLDLYMQTGVKEYWIVDPNKTEVYVYSFGKDSGEYFINNYETFKSGELIQSKAFKGLQIAIDELFNGFSNPAALSAPR